MALSENSRVCEKGLGGRRRIRGFHSSFFFKKNWNLGHRVIASQEHVFEIFGFGFGSVGGGRATEQDEWSLPPPEFLS
jgi:hypothetical protein